MTPTINNGSEEQSATKQNDADERSEFQRVREDDAPVIGPNGEVRISNKALLDQADLEFDQCFIREAGTNNIRFTASGIKEYRSRFARAGIDIRDVKTYEAFSEAREKSYPYWVEDLRKLVEGHKEIEDILKPLWS